MRKIKELQKQILSLDAKKQSLMEELYSLSRERMEKDRDCIPFLEYTNYHDTGGFSAPEAN